ncbi:MAG: hypothetical protein GWP04_08880 [Gammaproteobacteria bacterium]|nr:hypothetical protein [Gammaproteobacteria bacterium]
MPSTDRNEAGIAVVTVTMLLLLVGLIIVALFKEATIQYEQARVQEREDVIVAGAEAMLDRYAAKLTIDPLYYLHWVDEAERARRCDTATATEYGQIVQPGHAWFTGCETWSYLNPDRDGDGTPDTDPAWYVHPVLDDTGTKSDISILIEITPPLDGPVNALVVGKRGSSVQRRAITAGIHATALSEFYRAVQTDLSYGAYAETYGKIYAGGDISFAGDTTAHADVFAEGKITSAPAVWADGAEGWESSPTGSFNDIRDAYPQPLDFNDFWDDLDLVKNTACGGSGICLDDADATAWLVHAYVSGGVGKLRILKSTTAQSETWWWTEAQSSSAGWTLYGTFDIPDSGTLWANQHLIVGDRYAPVGVDQDGDGFTDSILRGSLTMYAGSAASRKNLIINADTYYDDPNSQDILGLVASDEIVINHNAVGDDRNMYINGALLAQYDRWRFSGYAPSESHLYTNGSIATRNVGAIASYIKYRHYGFDSRLEYLRPPMFPLLDNDWSYDNWKEVTLPDWAKP